MKTGRKGDKLMGEKEIDMLARDTTARQNMMDGNRRKGYSEVVIEGVRRKVREFIGESIVRETDRVLRKRDDVVVYFSGVQKKLYQKGWNKSWILVREDLF